MAVSPRLPLSVKQCAMPTNLIRRRLDDRPKAKRPSPKPEQEKPERIVRLHAGRHAVRLRLLPTRTADLLWSALPLYSIAETWGESLHFDTPMKTGRERAARLNVEAGDVCFWSEDERVVLAWGPTPISGANEIRLMRPCNIWAKAIDDPAVLRKVTAGEKVVLSRLGP